MAKGSDMLLLILINAAVIVGSVNSSGVCGPVCQNAETKLRNKLFVNSGYDPSVRPVKDPNKPVDVKIGVALSTVLDMNTVSGVAKLAVWLRASWYDPSLDWNSTEHGGIWQITQDVNKVWVPDFLAYNHVERFEKETRHEMTQLYVYSDGWGVYWSRPAVIRVLCPIDARHFPFDTQTCDLKFGAWSMSGFLQNLSAMAYTRYDDEAEGGKRRVENGEIDTSVFQKNEEFVVKTGAAERSVEFFACCATEPWPLVRFKLILTRKSAHYVVNVIMPTMVTSMVSMTTFMLPHETGERIGLGVTCILVICAIMFVSNDLMPISDDATVLGTFYAGCFFYTLLSLLVTVISAALYHQRDDIDSDGEAGSYFVTQIIGITPEQAVQLSFRLDFSSMIFFPLTFAGFSLCILNPKWSITTMVFAALGLIAGTIFLMLICFMILKSRTHNKHRSFTQIFWRFRRADSRGTWFGSSNDKPIMPEHVDDDQQHHAVDVDDEAVEGTLVRQVSSGTPNQDGDVVTKDGVYMTGQMNRIQVAAPSHPMAFAPDTANAPKMSANAWADPKDPKAASAVVKVEDFNDS